MPDAVVGVGLGLGVQSTVKTRYRRIEGKLLLVENHLCVLPINLKFLDISVEILIQRFVPDGNFSAQWY